MIVRYSPNWSVPVDRKTFKVQATEVTCSDKHTRAYYSSVLVSTAEGLIEKNYGDFDCGVLCCHAERLLTAETIVIKLFEDVTSSTAQLTNSFYKAF